MAWVKSKHLVILTMLLAGLVLSGCGGSAAVAPISKHAKGSRWSPDVHTVSRGETLYSIAFQYGQDYRTLARRNGIRYPYTIYVAQKLKLRGDSSPAKQVVSRPKPAPKPRQTAKPQASPPKAAKPPQRPPSIAANTGPLRWNWPTSGRVIKTFSSKSDTRKGIDIAGRLGQAIKAAGSGRIVYSGSGLRGYGKLIIVKHNEKYLSAYAHNRKLLVKEGDIVKLGQRIAEMGRSGADNVKLHFEIRREGNPVNPMRYLPKR